MPEINSEIHYRLDKMEETLKGSLSELTAAIKNLVELQTENKATKTLLERHTNKIEIIEKRIPIYDILVTENTLIKRSIIGVLIAGSLGSFLVFGGS